MSLWPTWTDLYGVPRPVERRPSAERTERKCAECHGTGEVSYLGMLFHPCRACGDDGDSRR